LGLAPKPTLEKLAMDRRVAPIALVVAAAWGRLASIEHNDRVISQSGGHIERNRCSGRPSSANVTEMRRVRTCATPNISANQGQIYHANDLLLRSCAGRS
jgi:hypothetical protein